MIKELSYKPNGTWDSSVVDSKESTDSLAKETKKL
jgi:hypothetical protein